MIFPVTRRSEFAALRSNGQRVRFGGLRMSYIESVDGGKARTHQVAFALSRKFGNAVERNRARRRLRSAFVSLIGDRADNPPPPGLYLLVPSRTVLTMPYRDLTKMLRSTFDRLETAALTRAKI